MFVESSDLPFTFRMAYDPQKTFHESLMDLGLSPYGSMEYRLFDVCVTDGSMAFPLAAMDLSRSNVKSEAKKAQPPKELGLPYNLRRQSVRLPLP